MFHYLVVSIQLSIRAKCKGVSVRLDTKDLETLNNIYISKRKSIFKVDLGDLFNWPHDKCHYKTVSRVAYLSPFYTIA